MLNSLELYTKTTEIDMSLNYSSRESRAYMELTPDEHHFAKLIFNSK